MMPAILTLIAIGLFIAGLWSLASLKRIAEPTESERADPYYTSVTLLFSTVNRGDEFRKVQRRTIWLFCGSMLLFYLARITFEQTAAI